MLKGKPKSIPLTQNRLSIIDEEDFDKCAWIGWRFDGRYAVHKISKRAKRHYPNESRMFLHNYPMRPRNGFQVDHVNGDGLDNRKENLRYCLPSQNFFNKRIASNNKSGYKGVHKFGKNRWRVVIRANRVLHHVGLFDDKEEAAKAYDEMAIKLFGEFARLNLK